MLFWGGGKNLIQNTGVVARKRPFLLALVDKGARAPRVSSTSRACFAEHPGTYVGDRVQSCVCPDAEIRTWYIVGDSGRNHDHGDTELLIFLPGSRQL